MSARARGADSESGFTIIELVVAMGILSIVAASLAGVFWAAIRTAGVAAHRSDGASIASREIESMHAVPYAQVGFYADQPGYQATWMDGTSYSTVTLGTASPSSGLVPQIQPETPDPQAASSFAPDPNPANASAILQGGVKYSVARHVVWVNAQDASLTYTQAYKRLTVIVTWTDLAGAHAVRQDSVLYPGGLGKYQGAQGGSTSSTSTTVASGPPSQPVLNAIAQLPSPSGETQMSLVWSQPSGGSPVTSYTVEYSPSASFPAGNITVIANLPSSITAQTVTNLTPATTYYFEIIAYAGSSSATSNVQSQSTLAMAAPKCTMGALNVTGASSLSTTGTILQTNGKMSENLTLSWTTTGNCNDTYAVKAIDPNNAADPSSPYALNESTGTYNATVLSSGSKSWAIGLHTFTVFDTSTSTTTAVVKTFKVCVHGSASC